MGDRLEYSFHSEGEGHGVQRKGVLEIATTKKVVDYITSGRGAMLDETRSTAREKVIDRVYGDNGEVVLRFDLDSLGRGYSGQPERNSSRAFDIIAQVEGVAAQEGWSDPRLQVSYSPAQGRRLDDFFVSFERPASTDDVELANRLQAAMWDAARFLRYYPSQPEDRERIGASVSPEGWFQVRVGDNNVLSAPPHRMHRGERVELLGRQAGLNGEAKEKHARLIALTGIVSVLDPLQNTP